MKWSVDVRRIPFAGITQNQVERVFHITVVLSAWLNQAPLANVQ